MRLYCFPCSGAGASTYLGWVRRVASFIDLYAINLPGREHRAAEAPLVDLDAVVDHLSEAIHAQEDSRPFAFFGHSMGALLAFETARRLRKQRRPTPCLLAVSSVAAPQLEFMAQQTAQLLAKDPARLLRNFCAVQPEVLADPNVASAALPPLLADLVLLLRHHYVPEAPLDIPLAICGSDKDPMVPLDRLSAWKDQTVCESSLHLYPGGHFYLNELLPELLSDLNAEFATAYHAVGEPGVQAVDADGPPASPPAPAFALPDRV
ncbi:Gramicidin S biosynthesis protein GrsT [Stigmatella aurantiaca DW4/3-1]|uniref:Gramicidin S biosynthesis protein GrsT n=2 Tax=Stigmatella aurantiaca TaxID=41 RepID=Q099Y4_STIAD|nr:Gramicidin S biosynthesis protein GrsT [Stigmatella aurantiaca DW4/3-1]EAU68545.1 gramicidin S biosynthesis protein GrsT [Stigmatella aurantiaca DW4/3-1]